MQRSRRAQRLWQRARCAGHVSYFCTVTPARLLVGQCQHGRLSRALPSDGQRAWTCPRSFLGADLGHALSGAPSPGLVLKDLGLPMPLPLPRTAAPLQERFSLSLRCQKFLPSSCGITCLW